MEISGHTPKKSGINLVVNDGNKPLVNTDIIAFQSGWKINKNESLKVRYSEQCQYDPSIIRVKK